MNKLIHIAFVLLCFSAFGQDWRDSLTVAREAYKKADYSKALKYYESAQKKAPDNIDLSDEMAQSAYKAREFEKAEKIYQQSGNSKKSAINKADNYHNLGNSRMKSKNYQGAIDAYKESLHLNPYDNNTRYNLSEAIRQLKNEQKKQQNQEQNQDKQNKDKKNEENKPQQGQPKQNKQQGKPKEGEGDSKENGKGQLPNKTVDRMLDKLMKDEAETKRKINATNGKNQTPKSGKDW
ncbi:MAG: tetratricopeptide repeat protein [Crocinitomicaceae bacterium]